MTTHFIHSSIFSLQSLALYDNFSLELYRKAMLLIAVLVPWLSFFLRGKILSGILCLLLQITIIGWLPAALWAVASRVDGKNASRMRRMERRVARG